MSSILTRFGSRLRTRSRIAVSAVSSVIGRAGQRRVREEPVHRAFEIAAVRGDGAGHVGDHRRADVEGRMQRLQGRDAGGQDRGAQLPRRARRPRPRGRRRAASARARRGSRDRSAAGRPRRRSGGPASISALRVWPNSCWICLPWMNCTSSMMRRSMPRSRSLKASEVCAFSEATKPYMKRSAVR